MPSQLISSTGCCQPCDSEPIVVNTPGPQGAAGTNGTNGANGIDSFTSTTASFVIPPLASTVVVSVVNVNFIPQSAAGQFFVSIQGAGYFQVMSIASLQLTLKNPASGVLGVANAVPTTVVSTNALVTLAGGVGPVGAAGASGGAPVGASYVCRTSDGTLTNETALDLLAAGYMKTAGSGGAGVVSTVATVPVGDISGVLPVAKGGTNLSTVPTNGQLLIGNGTGYTVASLTAGSNITITPGAGTISIASTSAAAFNYVTFTRRVDSGTLPYVNPSPANQNIFSSTNYPSTNYTGIDTASGFNSVNGRFVVPYAGYYRLDALFIFTPAAGSYANAAIRKNGSTTLLPLSETATISPVAIGPFFLQYIDQAIAGDYYELVVTSFGSGGTVGANSSFSIQRIQA